MTGKALYILASSTLYEGENEDLDSKKFSVPFLNILLQEALNVENSIREAEGAELLGQAPLLQSLDDDIPYHDEVVRVAFPYGLAWQYRQEAMDNYWATIYRNLYTEALQNATKFVWEELC